MQSLYSHACFGLTRFATLHSLPSLFGRVCVFWYSFYFLFSGRHSSTLLCVLFALRFALLSFSSSFFLIFLLCILIISYFYEGTLNQRIIVSFSPRFSLFFCLSRGFLLCADTRVYQNPMKWRLHCIW